MIKMSLEAFLLGFIFINQIFGIQVNGQTSSTSVTLDVDQLEDWNCTRFFNQVEWYKIKCSLAYSRRTSWFTSWYTSCNTLCRLFASCLKQSNQWKEDCKTKFLYSNWYNSISRFDIIADGGRHPSLTKLHVKRCWKRGHRISIRIKITRCTRGSETYPNDVVPDPNTNLDILNQKGGNCGETSGGTDNRWYKTDCISSYWRWKSCVTPLTWCQSVASCLNQSRWWGIKCSNEFQFRLSQFHISTDCTDNSQSLTKIHVIRPQYYPWVTYKVSFNKMNNCSCDYVDCNNENDSVIGNEDLLVRNEPVMGFLTTVNEKDFRQENALQEVVEAFETTIKQFQNVSSGDSGANITSQQQPEEVLMITTVLEEFALKFVSYHLNNTMRSINLTSDQVNLRARRVFNQSEQDFRLVETGKEKDNYIAIPSEDFGENGSLILAVLYKNIHDLLVRNQPDNDSSGEERRFNTIIMSATIDPQNTLQQNVTLGFRNLQAGEGPRKCVFWEFSEDKSDWSEVGCTVQSMSRSQTVCSCNHLTHFAVLMQFEDDTESNYELTQADEEILKVITYVGLTLSLIGIILTIICYVNFTDIQAPLSQTRVSLVASLGAGQIIFIAGINATENKGACVAVAALMQYFFMAAFCWMLFEGIFLYLFVVKVYNLSNKMFIYHGFSWGFPAILVSLSLSIAAEKNGIESFVSNDYCWMSSENNLKWIFIAFVVMVEVLNVLILVRVIREMTTMQEVKDKQREQLRLGIRACVVLIPLLGVTWLFGLMTSLHKAFAYIFTILNSTQGLFIFLLHCVRNTEIRARFRRKISTILPALADSTASQVDKSDIPKHDKNKKSNESLNTD